MFAQRQDTVELIKKSVKGQIRLAGDTQAQTLPL